MIDHAPDPKAPVIAVLAADDGYSRPLAVTLRSIVAHLSEGRALELYLCDMGITAENRALIESVVDRATVTIHWNASLAGRVEGLPRPIPWITTAAYARLFIAEVLPATIDRAIYLDCDLIARHCIGDLFDTPTDTHTAMAVRDSGSPFVASPYGVPNWFRYGRRADDPNFNTGVLLMDVARWRDEQVGEAALEYLTDGRHQRLIDQEALNAVLPGRIGELDPRWNQQPEHYEALFQSTLPYSDDAIQELVKDPWIVHFSSKTAKPWLYESTHPFRDEWFASLDATPYGGWRPSRAQYLKQRGREEMKRVQKGLELFVASNDARQNAPEPVPPTRTLRPPREETTVSSRDWC